MIIGVGELSALGTAVTWGISSQVHGHVARLVGPAGLTLLRMPFQVFFLALMCLFMQPDIAWTLEGLGYLAASALAGIYLCDFFVSYAMFTLGPATAALLLSSSTAFSALVGWVVLDETLPPQVWAGIALTMLGIFFVVTENRGSTLLPGQARPVGKALLLGVGAGLLAGLTLAFSFLFLKQGLQTGVDTLWGTFIRLIIGACLLWGLGAAHGWPGQAVRGARQHPKVCLMLLFSCFFSAVGLWCASFAVVKAPVGVAATLIGLQSITVTIIGALWYRKMPSLRIIAGTLVAFGGVALICLR